MSSMSTTGNTSSQEIKPQILHNRMPPILSSSPMMTNCTQGHLMMSPNGPQGPEGQDQLLGGRFGYGYHHLYPYGGYGGYGLGYGWGYPYRGCCRSRGYYPWYYF